MYLTQVIFWSCFRLEAPCPSNHNPADFYIQLLAIVPTQEDECRNKIQKICDSYESSEYAQRLNKELGRQKETKVGLSIFANHSVLISSLS